MLIILLFLTLNLTLTWPKIGPDLPRLMKSVISNGVRTGGLLASTSFFKCLSWFYHLLWPLSCGLAGWTGFCMQSKFDSMLVCLKRLCPPMSRRFNKLNIECFKILSHKFKLYQWFKMILIQSCLFEDRILCNLLKTIGRILCIPFILK